MTKRIEKEVGNTRKKRESKWEGTRRQAEMNDWKKVSRLSKQVKKARKNKKVQGERRGNQNCCCGEIR